MGEKTETGFWEYARDKAVRDARLVVEEGEFAAMAKVFAEAWGPAVRARDYGWFAKLEEGHLSRLVQCVSPNESAFGQAKFDHVRNAQEGLCAGCTCRHQDEPYLW
jgi:hypothetical protein